MAYTRQPKATNKPLAELDDSFSNPCSSRSADSLKYSRGAHATADAHRHHAITAVASFQFAQDRCGQFCARASERMAQRDRAAVNVDLVGIQLEHLDHC